MTELLKTIRETGYQNHPIENPALAEQTDYIRDGYFRMLALILVEGGEVTEGQHMPVCSSAQRIPRGLRNTFAWPAPPPRNSMPNTWTR